MRQTQYGKGTALKAKDNEMEMETLIADLQGKQKSNSLALTVEKIHRMMLSFGDDCFATTTKVMAYSKEIGEAITWKTKLCSIAVNVDKQ